MTTTVESTLLAFIHVILFASNDVTAGGSLCAGVLCKSGQCVGRTAFCNGRCDCADCSDENVQTCPLSSEPDRGSGGGDGSGLGSGAIVGIVVAAICVLLLLIAILIIFLICRIRREAQKNLRSRRGPLEPQGPGCALPVNIPIEALARRPPPQYTPREMTPCPVGGGEFNISILPPPYYAPGSSAIAEFSCAYEAPPKYQSSNDLSKPVPDDGKVRASGESVDLRRNSVDSFIDEPSMSNILLTSSRSSGLGFESQAPSSNSRSRSCLHLNSFSSPPPRRGTGSGGSTSPGQLSSLTATSRSLSLSNMYSGSEEIPGREIQKPSGKERTVLPARSVPCLSGIQGSRAAPPSGASTDETSAKEKPRQGKYRKKTNDERCSADNGGDRRTPSSVIASRGGGVRLRDPASSSSSASYSSSLSLAAPEALSSAAHGLSTRRRISRSLPQLMILHEEDQTWREMDSCDV